MDTLDQTVLNTTDKLYWMLYDHITSLTEELNEFKQEYINAKRTKKLNQVFDEVLGYVNYEDDDEKYLEEWDYNTDDVMVAFGYDGDTQLPISICIKRLSRERIEEIWKKLFPIKKQHAIMDLLDEWQEEGMHGEYDVHIVHCVDHDGENELSNLEKLESMCYSVKEVRSVIDELTLSELVDISPKIKVVKHKLIK